MRWWKCDLQDRSSPPFSANMDRTRGIVNLLLDSQRRVLLCYQEANDDSRSIQMVVHVESWIIEESPRLWWIEFCIRRYGRRGSGCRLTLQSSRCSAARLMRLLHGPPNDVVAAVPRLPR
jgi:hypothetical protein